MDVTTFDRLTKTLALGGSRRAALGALLASGLGTVLGQLSAAGQATCKAPGQVCRKRSDCCATRCRKEQGKPQGCCQACEGGRLYCNGACCAAGEDCIGGSCTCAGASCPGGCCASGVCVSPSTDAQCGTGGEACVACTAPETCGGGGTPGDCGCPKTPEADACGGKCGQVDDGCGGKWECGGCAAPESCGGGGTANVCGCLSRNTCCGTDSGVCQAQCCSGEAAAGLIVCGGQFSCVPSSPGGGCLTDRDCDSRSICQGRTCCVTSDFLVIDCSTCCSGSCSGSSRCS